MQFYPQMYLFSKVIDCLQFIPWLIWRNIIYNLDYLPYNNSNCKNSIILYACFRIVNLQCSFLEDWGFTSARAPGQVVHSVDTFIVAVGVRWVFQILKDTFSMQWIFIRVSTQTLFNWPIKVVECCWHWHLFHFICHSSSTEDKTMLCE